MNTSLAAMDVASCILIYLLVTLVTDCVGFTVNTRPTARIIVHVSKRRAEFWDPWEVNRRLCPPSLCKSSDQSGKGQGFRPRGTAGTPFYQGDIVLNDDEVKYVYEEARKRRKRATMRIRKKLWKDGIIPYKMDKEISKAAESAIRQAMKHIESRTCIRFRERKASEKDYVRFISEPGVMGKTKPIKLFRVDGNQIVFTAEQLGNKRLLEDKVCCWSNVGKKGGAQLVSLGRGCENIGTAVHETTHALGIWHEQARPDRDKYIKVIKENISPRFLPDFKILNKRLVTSRGYPYDYYSVMHYNKFAFTKVGKPTIKVIGIGQKLKVKPGQRKGLSTIDIAQLRDMYHCNRKEDTKATVCFKGWRKFQTNCYKFYAGSKQQFAGAFRECRKIGAHLVSIETKSEHKFLEKQLVKRFPTINVWRIGGKRINATVMWFKGDKTRPRAMKYTNWAKSMPSTYTSAALVKDKNSKKFLWHGIWAGSSSQLPQFAYPFICEKRARRKCVVGRYKDGRDYRGKLDHTMEGVTCQKWSEQYPHEHKQKPRTNTNKEDTDGLGNHNYCRNPSGQRRRQPWCYTTKAKKKWQYCDVTICSKKKGQNEVSISQIPKKPKTKKKPRKQKPRKQKPRRQRPRVQKPRVQKPRVQKPRVQKPQVRKPARARKSQRHSNTRRQTARRKINTKPKIKPTPGRTPNRRRVSSNKKT